MKHQVLAFRPHRRRYRTRSLTSLGWAAIGIVGALGVLVLGVMLGFLIEAFGLWATLRIIAGVGAFAIGNIGWHSARYGKIETAAPALCFAVILLAFAVLGPKVIPQHDRPAPRGQGAFDQERAQMFKDAGLAPERPRR